MSEPTSPALAENKGRAWIYWIAAWAMIAVYVATYAGMIRQQTAVPYWDQSNYVLKTYHLVDKYNEVAAGKGWRGELRRLDPKTYLGANPTLRPPLLEMLPAMIWGHRATAHEMAYTWLALRACFLLAGLWILSKEVRSAAWVPAALALILASQPFLKLNQNLYMMDVPFTAWALVTVALTIRAMRIRTAAALSAACWATVALLLIKPQALAFMFMFFAVLIVERLFYEVRLWKSSPQHRLQLLALLRWCSVLIALLLVIAYIMASPYGKATASQYKLNTQGFWSHDLTGPLLRAILVGLLAPWTAALILLAAAIVLYRFRRRKKSRAPAPAHCAPLRKFLLLIALGAAWWIAFNLFLTFGIDPRLIWSISPVLFCAACILLLRVPILGAAATAFAIVLFALALSITAAAKPFHELPNPAAILGPRIVYQQPIADIGVREMVHQTLAQLTAAPPPKPAQVYVLACDEYVEADAFNLAGRWQNHDQPSPIHFQAPPWADDGFDLAATFTPRNWFITKTVRPTTNLSPNAFVNLLAISALVSDPASPLHPLFDRRITVPTQQPTLGETPLFKYADENQTLHDSLILWRLRRQPTPAELAAALAFIQPRYHAHAGAARMAEQLAHFQTLAQKGSTVDIIPESALPAPPAPPAAPDPKTTAAQNLSFDLGLTLRAVTLTREKQNLRVTLYWQAQKPLDLTATRYFHLLGAQGQILRQADAPLDPLAGHVAAHTLWRDTLILTPAQLQNITTFGIGLITPDNRQSLITPGPSQPAAPPPTLDWSNHRLLIPVPKSPG